MLKIKEQTLLLLSAWLLVVKSDDVGVGETAITWEQWLKEIGVGVGVGVKEIGVYNIQACTDATAGDICYADITENSVLNYSGTGEGLVVLKPKNGMKIYPQILGASQCKEVPVDTFIQVLMKKGSVTLATKTAYKGPACSEVDELESFELKTTNNLVFERTISHRRAFGVVITNAEKAFVIKKEKIQGTDKYTPYIFYKGANTDKPILCIHKAGENSCPKTILGKTVTLFIISTSIATIKVTGTKDN